MFEGAVVFQDESRRANPWVIGLILPFDQLSFQIFEYTLCVRLEALFFFQRKLGEICLILCYLILVLLSNIVLFFGVRLQVKEFPLWPPVVVVQGLEPLGALIVPRAAKNVLAMKNINKIMQKIRKG